jgi:hypothetical protein
MVDPRDEGMGGVVAKGVIPDMTDLLKAVVIVETIL